MTEASNDLPEITWDHLLGMHDIQIPVWLFKVKETTKTFQQVLNTENKAPIASYIYGDFARTKRVFLEMWQVEDEIKSFIESNKFGKTHYIVSQHYMTMFKEIIKKAESKDRPKILSTNILMTTVFKINAINEMHINLREHFSGRPRPPSDPTRRVATPTSTRPSSPRLSNITAIDDLQRQLDLESILNETGESQDFQQFAKKSSRRRSRCRKLKSSKRKGRRL